MSVRSPRRGASVFAALLLCLAPVTARGSAPEVETAVSATQVEVGEALTLELRLRGKAAAQEPDLSGLAPDFDVRAVQRVERTSVVNGARDASIDYVVQIAARREGDLVIPALPVGETASQPVAIHVAPLAAAPPDQADRPLAEAPAQPAWVEARVDRENPYEQERVLLTVDLYAEGELLDGALTAPEIPGLAVAPLGKDRPIEKSIDGHRYRGIERSYVIVPDTVGTLVVPPVRFEGRVRVAQPAARPRLGGMRGRSFFDDLFSDAFRDDFFAGVFGGGLRRLALASKPLRLEVRERPGVVSGQWWLPARDVSLTESLEPEAGPVRVGEPLTRRIEIRADGVSAAQLPALEMPEIAGVKRYAEAPQVQEGVGGTVRVDETTLIPTRPGTVTLPAVELAWWDTESDSARTARVAARTLEVVPAATASAAHGSDQPAPVAEVAPATVPPPPQPLPRRPELRGSALLAACVLLAVLAAVVIARRRASLRSGAVAPPSRAGAERALRRACRSNDATGAEAALRSLGALQGGVPAGLAREIARLMAVRYSRAGASWRGAPLWAAFRVARKARRSSVRTEPEALPRLYPTR